MKEPKNFESIAKYTMDWPVDSNIIHGRISIYTSEERGGYASCLFLWPSSDIWNRHPAPLHLLIDWRMGLVKITQTEYGRGSQGKTIGGFHIQPENYRTASDFADHIRNQLKDTIEGIVRNYEQD